MSSLDNSVVSDTNSIVLNWNNIPCVQYGFSEGDGPPREAKLRTIFQPIPDNAETASPVYLLSHDQYERQQQLDSGYEVAGNYTSIATELQDECEADGSTNRVLYPIHIESDVYHEKEPATLIDWFREFVEDYLDVPFHTCTLYFSGRRSIHVHVPRFVPGEDQRERLKELAETFCEETGAELDCGLYDPKRMFRLPGVEHAKTGLLKVEIEPKWSHDRIFQKANEATPDVPESYEAVLRYVFATKPSLTIESQQTAVDPPYDLFQVLDSKKTVLELEPNEQDIAIPLIEEEQCPDEGALVPHWARYNAKEFSPYALAAKGNRSVAALRVMNTPFARSNKRNGATMVPAWFYGAIGCSGEYTKQQEHAPLQLSKQDYDKWPYEPGDTLVIIGGQSRNSKLLLTSVIEACIVGSILSSEHRGRDAALNYLSEKGYDVGSTESTGSTSFNRDLNSIEASHIFPAREQPQTEAERLQLQAEQDGIETLSHKERSRVACRHLRYGWQPAWEWFKRQFGSSFKPEVTHQQFQSIIKRYPEDYSHVEVPAYR